LIVGQESTCSLFQVIQIFKAAGGTHPFAFHIGRMNGGEKPPDFIALSGWLLLLFIHYSRLITG
jgi:hypothetical protein